MNTTFMITGGAGRVVASIPALEKYHRLNPNDNFKVLVHGWHQLFWSHPMLQDRTFDANLKGTFDLHVKPNKAVVPEPYHLRSFYNQEKNIIQAFDEIINQTDDHSDLDKPNLYVSQFEDKQTLQIINQIKQENNNKKLIVIQPFGSGCVIVNNYPHDASARSLSPKDYVSITNALKDEAVFLYASSKDMQPSDDVNISIDKWNPYMRVMPAFIKHCDYFIGCDSVGQHVARAFNKKGTVIMGGTSELNFSYPDFFNIYRKPGSTANYAPWRLCDIDVNFVDRKNEGVLDLNSNEVDEIINIIKKDLNSNIQHKFMLR